MVIDPFNQPYIFKTKIMMRLSIGFLVDTLSSWRFGIFNCFQMLRLFCFLVDELDLVPSSCSMFSDDFCILLFTWFEINA